MVLHYNLTGHLLHPHLDYVCGLRCDYMEAVVISAPRRDHRQRELYTDQDQEEGGIISYKQHSP